MQKLANLPYLSLTFLLDLFYTHWKHTVTITPQGFHHLQTKAITLAEHTVLGLMVLPLTGFPHTRHHCTRHWQSYQVTGGGGFHAWPSIMALLLY